MSSTRTPQIRKRRSTGKLVVLNEEELIHQVQLRPILYDRTLKSFRKSSLRQMHWQEVSDVMGATTDECRRRWRSLRDSFAKHYKQVQRTEDEHTRNKHRKWVFYDQMSFMIPYMDNASYSLDDHLIEEFGDNSDDQSIHCETSSTAVLEQAQGNQNTTKMENHIEQRHSNDHVQQNTVSVQATDFMPVPEETEVMDHHHSHHQHHTPNRYRVNQNGEYKNRNNEETPSYYASPNNYFDSDEKFLLSCAPAMRRLTNRQNAIARLQIQQLLFDIEFGNRQNHD
ncbi:transcription factor Adf-1-like [Musca vetustissima]|uniref:transcription factor Adf-1-like n=1 Tax=Musca vetustissima TaxID=27455 RepID=UPI002AB7323D|nr:transcription factor Adf-1-like [Musca vetustissima]